MDVNIRARRVAERKDYADLAGIKKTPKIQIKKVTKAKKTMAKSNKQKTKLKTDRLLLTPQQETKNPVGSTTELVGIEPNIGSEVTIKTALKARVERVIRVKRSRPEIDYALLAGIKMKKFCDAEIENGLIGEPVVDCADNYFQVNFETRSSFKGIVFVQNYLESTECRTFPSPVALTNASLRIPFHDCGVVNTLSTSPRGIFLSASVVVAFNPDFLTKNDRVFKIQCFYMEMERRIQKEIQITTPPGTMLSKQIPMPVCKYEVLDGSPTGPPVYFATVGQMVYHKWSCETEHEGTFCMLVHSCFVNDGNGQSVQLLNDKGCALDKYLLTNLEYPTDLMAGREAHVYKYADRDNMYFDCQISITVKEPGQDYCDVPQCPDPPRRRRSDNNTSLESVEVTEESLSEFVYPSEDIIKIGWIEQNFLMGIKEMCMTTLATSFFVFTNFSLIFLATFILIRTFFLKTNRKIQ